MLIVAVVTGVLVSSFAPCNVSAVEKGVYPIDFEEYLASVPVAQSDSIKSDSIFLSFHFEDSSDTLNMGYMNNADLMDSLSSFFAVNDDNSSYYVGIRSSASPQGGEKRNGRLARSRSALLQKILTEYFLPADTARVTFDVESWGEDWRSLKVLVRESDMDNDDKRNVLELMDKPYYTKDKDGHITGGRKEDIMLIDRGRVWFDLRDRFFHLLRASHVKVVRYSDVLTKEPVSTNAEPGTFSPDAVETVAEPLYCDDADLKADSELNADSVTLSIVDESEDADKIEEPAEAPFDASMEKVLSERSRYMFGIRTNLLLDAVTALNIGVEVPVGQRYSIAADYYFPWWKIPSSNLTMECQAALLEGRYWFGNRDNRDVMTGLSAGVYIGAGLYDFQFGGDGIQGEFFLMGGVDATYAHIIGRNLRLEYSLGFGYLQTDYREYSPVKGTEYGDIKVRKYPWTERRQRWFGPTKAQVSLVWMIDRDAVGFFNFNKLRK